MAYCTSTDVKVYLGVNSTLTEDDTLLTALIARAQAQIEMHTRRVFQSTANSTRYFTVGEDTDGRVLSFDDDICSIATVTTNADSTAPTTVSSTQYVKLPRNEAPYYGIRLKDSESVDWEYTDDPVDGITVSGKWAYSTTPPADIKNACIRLSAYYYRLKDSQLFDVQAVPEAGVITVPQGIPRDVQLILDPYIKRM